MTRKKLIKILIASFVFVAAIGVVGVYAALSQTFKINGAISFTGDIDENIACDVAVFGENGDDPIVFQSGSNTRNYSVTTGAFDVLGVDDTSAYSAGLGKNVSSGSTDLILSFDPDEDGEPNTITLNVVIKNVGTEAFSVDLSDATKTYIQNVENVDVEIVDSVSGASGQVSSLDETVVLDINAVLIKTFTFSVANADNHARFDTTIEFVLSRVANYE